MKITHFCLSALVLMTNTHMALAKTINTAPLASPSSISPTGEIILAHLWSQIDSSNALKNGPLVATAEVEKVEEKQDVKQVTPALDAATSTSNSASSTEPGPSKTSKPAELTKGQQYVKSMMQKNREWVKQIHAQKKQTVTKEAPKTGSAETNKNPFKRRSDSSIDLKEVYLKHLSDLKRTTKHTYEAWELKHKETMARWQQKQKEFDANLPYYQGNLISFETPAYSISQNKLTAPLSLTPPQEYHVVTGALDLPVRDQGRRPTCSAFAGIRAIEILLKGNGEERDLSEQYFYWASKPSCQNAPCTQRGSWVLKGFTQSQKASQKNIPLEAQCPYQDRSMHGNETQVPLASPCMEQGTVKVQDFNQLQDLDEVIKTLNNNSPVIAGFKLTPNFYINQGLVSQREDIEEPVADVVMDSHAVGHALLFVGYIKLPPQLQDEGKVCFITANSWGEGWGAGGHACLTEKWVLQHRVPNAFVTLTSLEI